MVILAAGAGLAAGAWTDSGTRPPEPTGVTKRLYQPASEIRSGDEVVLVFIAGSFCGAHRREGFADAIERAKAELARRTRADGRQFRAVGVSLDWNVDTAMDFLRHFGAFDEVALGGNWIGQGAVRYVWRDLPGEPVVPQIVVVERSVTTGHAITVSPERVLKRITGADAIDQWAKAGAPL